MKTSRSECVAIILVAIAYTALNAFKPLHIDDTAYYLFARHIQGNPSDPYGFLLYWYSAPQPAMTVVAPPVFLYYFSGLISLFGENPFLWKLACFPIYALLLFSTYSLIKRFVGEGKFLAFIFFVVSPAILPAANLMLDIPALSLYVASLAVFFGAIERPSFRMAVIAGILAGLAVQTKYSALSLLPVALFAAYGMRRSGLGIAFGISAAATFVIIESLIVVGSGASHFLSQLAVKGETRFLSNLTGNIGQMGGLAFSLVPLWLVSKNFPKRVLVLYMFCSFLLLITGTVLPPDSSFIVFCVLFYSIAFIFGLFASHFLVFETDLKLNLKKLFAWRRKDSISPVLFIAAWIGIEFLMGLITGPFPAMRRIIGLTLPFVILTFQVFKKSEMKISPRIVTVPLIAMVLFSGMLLLLDFQLAAKQRDAVATTVNHIRQIGADGYPVWYLGSWGFKYYAERAGMLPLTPEKTHVAPGDFVIYPERGVSRPEVHFPTDSYERVLVIEDSPLRGVSTKFLYSGMTPIRKMTPVYRIILYRCIQESVLVLH